MSIILVSVISLGVIGAVGTIILFLVSKKFKVNEDPRIALVQDALPAANCGGCGFPGCGGFATACVNASSLSNLNCPVGGNSTMEKVAGILGMTVEKTEPKIAVIRCNGSCDNRQQTSLYDGASSCSIAAALYGGDTDCSYGCLGLGDCKAVCQFGAIKMNPSTRLPEIDEEKCTACGACAKACPKMLIELRKKGTNSRRIYVSCMNKDKGGVARKACTVACIGCNKCEKACTFDAISIQNNLAYIDDEKCRLCRKCVKECPTSAITELNFPVRRESKELATTTTIG
ncbi:Fe-S cluster domain-containing protein [Dysgonomonas sp. 216]|uniref:Fe-S cluster domain-containing protein n=1 Tax=Dysgonomonas sp. 216 TaxID=2302934 RepID=UPI0013D4088D|nr:Fe-S cluster domain-containing protein [Dysgonomonas sp. 216]NDW17514.1 Fe-S cluster domain-containing protein [Dysgonomonas sp. 216]